MKCHIWPPIVEQGNSHSLPNMQMTLAAHTLLQNLNANFKYVRGVTVGDTHLIHQYEEKDYR